MKSIYLIGPMGSGKTTLGKALAEYIDFDFVDLDEWIEKEEEQSIAEIFANDGEFYFRNIESLSLLSTKSWEDTIIACGGGIVERPQNRQFLQSQKVVNLTVDVKTALSRIGKDKNRPLLNSGISPEEQWLSLFSKRKKWYQSCADFNFSTIGHTKETALPLVSMLLGMTTKE